MEATAKQRTVGRGNGRKTVTENIEATGHFSPQDAIWKAIRALKGKSFDRASLCSRLIRDGVQHLNDETIASYLNRLEAGGYLKAEKQITCNRIVGAPKLYTLERDVGNETPRLRRDGSVVTQGNGNDRMWRSMKMLKDFTYIELQASASVDGELLNASTVRTYIKRLVAAKYLAVTKAGGPGKPARYTLLPTKNTGPHAPMIQRLHQVYDANLRKVVWGPAK